MWKKSHGDSIKDCNYDAMSMMLYQGEATHVNERNCTRACQDFL